MFVVALLAVAVSAAEHKVRTPLQTEYYSRRAAPVHQQRRSTRKSQGIFGVESESTHTEVFYDSLMSMQMALNAGEIDEMALPEAVAEYVMNVNDTYKINAIIRTPTVSLALVFRSGDDTILRNRFNEVLLSMKADGTLAILIAKYIDEPCLDEPEPVKFAKYDNIDTTTKIAVTGDIPLIDYIAHDGTPVGFNTAVLAELAKCMKVNVTLINIESGAHAAALASKRADVVFWFEYHDDGIKIDVPEGIMLSEQYYSWNGYIDIAKK